MIKLDVWLTLPTGEYVRTGELVVDDPDNRGDLQGRFRYVAEYLDHPKAFPLDPVRLPLATDIFDADRPRFGVHGVFEDSLPDDWGRKLMVRHYKLGKDEQRVPHLLRLHSHSGIGALSYVESGEPPPPQDAISSHHLQELSILAEKFEQDGFVPDEELSFLFQAGSSPGGARPKVLVRDERQYYIAKFASAKDTMDVVSLEAAAMELARRAGVDTAETKIMPLGARKCLLVKRFDMNDARGRNHLISMQTLLKADGYYYAGYRDIADVLRKVSAAPQRDLQMLFRQMIFNALTGNTDDHLKNFCMLHNDEGWILSPAFDLVPNIGMNREHVLRIGLDYRAPGLQVLLAEAKYFGIKRRQAVLDLVEEIYSAVSEWPAVFSDFSVPEKDAATIGKDIARRLKKVSPTQPG